MNSTNYMSNTRKALLSNDELTQLLAISDVIEDPMPTFKKSNTHHLYMQFFEISLANKSNKSLRTLTLNEQHLLEQIAIHCETGKPLTVKEACQMRQLGSISTVHHQIHKLNDLGLIFLEVDQGDLNTKILNLSSDGLEYFKQIEDCLDRALMHQ